jgi:hypothetical protein
MMNQLEITVSLTFKDYLAATYSIALKRFTRYIVIALLVSVFLTLNSILNSAAPFYWQGYLYPTGFVALLFAGTYFEAKRTWGLRPQLREPTQYTFSDAGVRLEASSVRAEHNWGNFLKMVQTKTQLLLFLTENQLLIFPVGSFQNEGHLSQIRDFVSSHLSPINMSNLKESNLKVKLISYAIAFVVTAIVILYAFLSAGR